MWTTLSVNFMVFSSLQWSGRTQILPESFKRAQQLRPCSNLGLQLWSWSSYRLWLVSWVAEMSLQFCQLALGRVCPQARHTRRLIRRTLLYSFLNIGIHVYAFIYYACNFIAFCTHLYVSHLLNNPLISRNVMQLAIAATFLSYKWWMLTIPDPFLVCAKGRPWMTSSSLDAGLFVCLYFTVYFAIPSNKCLRLSMKIF